MTWTYTEDPSNIPLDEVRVLVGDVDTTDQLVSDEIINYALTKGGVYYAAAIACRHLAAKYGRLSSASVGGVSESAGELMAHYLQIADEMEAKNTVACTPTFGGITTSEHETDEADTSLPQPAFKRGQFDNPEAGGSSDSTTED